MISINASSEGILRNTFALEFRVHQEKSLEKILINQRGESLNK